MATFPTLKTGAVAQYPLDWTVSFQTQAVRFLDGSRQRYRLRGVGLRRWSVKLDLLDDRELSAVVQFVEQQGSAAFAFLDPVTGVNAAKCVISGDKFDAVAKSDMNAQATVSIEEIL